jgi:tetratricopeptide (TPR) repeat protein
MGCNVKNVAETLRAAKRRGMGATVLIGAGCSVTAGIPLASKFVEIISQQYPLAYSRAESDCKPHQPQYPHCMAQLSEGERKELIAPHVKEAKLNWTHLALAQLMREGYIDHVLTVNFDPLVIRACAFLGLFPAVYDLAASPLFNSADIPDQAVFYLHGQHTGFVLKYTTKECEEQSRHLGQVFDHAGRRRPWLVVGYSGDNDPVFEHLAGVERFDFRLYWVGYKDNPPIADVRTKLLEAGKDAFLVPGLTADDFFVTLAQELDCFPPEFVKNPLSHLDRLFERVGPYTIPGQESSDVTDSARKLIRDAIEHFKDPPATADGSVAQPATAEDVTLQALKANFLLMGGRYDEVLTYLPANGSPAPPEIAEPVSWAYIMQGAALANQAKQKTGAEAERLYELACEKYAQALALKPDMHVALYNWGRALFNQAKLKTDKGGAHLFALAGEKFEQALALKPDMHEALYNWAVALSDQAKLKAGVEANRLLTLAAEKYGQALALKPDQQEELHNRAVGLAGQAKLKAGEGTDRLSALAELMYGQALTLKADIPGVLADLGIALLNTAKQKRGKDADRLWGRAEKILLSGEHRVPGQAAYSLACLHALRGNESKAHYWLMKSHRHGYLPDRQHLDWDPDLDSIRGLPWFQEVLQRL